MIFGKGKKDQERRSFSDSLSGSFKRPLESAAVNRWRSVERGEKQEDEDSDNNTRDFSFGFTPLSAEKTTKHVFNKGGVSGNSFSMDKRDGNKPSGNKFEETEVDSEFKSLKASMQIESEETFEDSSNEEDLFDEDLIGPEEEFSEEFQEEELVSLSMVVEEDEIEAMNMTEEYADHDSEEEASEETTEMYDEYTESHASHPELQTPIQEEPVQEVQKIQRERTPMGDFSISAEQDIANRFGTNLKSALGSGTVIEGMFSFENPVKIDGVLRGEIKSSSALIVGPKAKVIARIQVGSLIILGEVEGEIEAEDLIEIRANGSLDGDIVTRRLALEEGGVLNGTCTMID